MAWVQGFLQDESGVITIDWVTLTAGILLLGTTVVYSLFNGGVAALTGDINGTLSGAAVDPHVGMAPDLNAASGGTSTTSNSDSPTTSDCSACHGG